MLDPQMPNGLPDRELVSATLAKIRRDADAFYLQQQQQLKAYYMELCSSLEQLHGSVRLSRMASSNTEGVRGTLVSPFSCVASGGAAAAHSNAVQSTSPLQNAIHNFSTSGNFITSPFASRSNALMMAGDSTHAARGAHALSTPPNRHVATDRPSPCMSRDDLGGTGEWPSCHTGVLQDNSVMASPQSTVRLPLDELLLRFTDSESAAYINFSSIYEHLLDDEDGSPSGTTGEGGDLNMTCGSVDPSGGARPTGSGGQNIIPVDNLRSLHDHHLTTSVRAVYENGRPKVIPIPDGPVDNPEALGIDRITSCQVLVEFKRKRVLQYASKMYVAPGSYVVVGGDRGEDLGLVIYTWCETKPNTGGTLMDCATPIKGNAEREMTLGTTLPTKSRVVGVGLSGSTLTRNIGVGSGKVLKVAQEVDEQQLHGVQAELERRAIDVCTQRVLGHGLPMIIVDAEYQFDKKKLTFFYEARERLDFRELVRDLYKTFRARIWMELVE